MSLQKASGVVLPRCGRDAGRARLVRGVLVDAGRAPDADDARGAGRLEVLLLLVVQDVRVRDLKRFYYNLTNGFSALYEPGRLRMGLRPRAAQSPRTRRWEAQKDARPEDRPESHIMI